MSDTPVSVTDLDLRGELPTGTVVLEASAGTGKTYAIVSLAVRFLAEGTPVDRLLMATFSNAASDELRDRTRSRIVECLAALRNPDQPSDDEVVQCLREGPSGDVEQRRRRLTEALTDFDAATVATTHTFCNRMLGALGFLGERDQRYPIVENVDDLVAELAGDLYLSRFAGAPDSAPPHAVATEIAVKAVAQPTAVLAPNADEADEAAQVRLELGHAARTQIAARKGLARIRTYDDLQSVLVRIIADDGPGGVGPAARARIREQFSVVLIDEFQDTDPQQWEIISRCFHGYVPLVLVGDPKQSIYAFRGAEVRSYLDAVKQAGDKRRLATNWRSDGPLVEALGAIFGGTAFGHADIGYPQVTAKTSESRLTGAAPLRIRAFVTGDFRAPAGVPGVAAVREKVTEDVADDLAVLLNSGTLLDGVDGEGPRPVQPGDVAILVRANKSVEPLQEALADRGISSVVRSGTSIFKTPAARYWWYVLAAIEQPSNSRRVRLAALTPLLGRTARQLDAGGDEAVGALAAQLADLGRVYAEGGFASMSARLLDTFGTQERLLSGAGGERLLTDLRQLSDLCNRRSTTGTGGLASLVTWLSEQIADESALRHGEAQTRRLDRDTRAVQIMTVHASKGLEFPIVYVPFGWDGATYPNPETFLFHDDDDSDGKNRRYLDVGGSTAPGHAKREFRAMTEQAGEDLRLLYVAMTRARSQVVAWWGPSVPTKAGALHRLLFTAVSRSGVATSAIPPSVELPASDDDIVAGLRAVAALAPEQIAVEPAGRHPRGVRWEPEHTGDAPQELSAASFGRDIDQQWRRTSYSSIVRDAHAAQTGERLRTGSEPEDGLVDDEPDDPAERGDPAPEHPPAPGQPSPMNGLPYGAGFGTLVHEVLEHVDTSAADLAAHVHARTVEGAAHRGVDIDVDTLAQALMAVLTTPLGFGDLAGIGPADRLAELDFELPLAAPGFTLAAVGALLTAHLAEDDPLRAYADVVPTVSGESFRGYLTGSIDSVLRTPDGRFTVVDYKTNRLRPGDLTVEDFDTAAMAGEMMSAHYPLQALLYAVALHRYLRWRLPGYAPEQHLGPIQYHFVRGMAGPSTPPGCGVFDWCPPAALIVALSDLLAGAEAR